MKTSQPSSNPEIALPNELPRESPGLLQRWDRFWFRPADPLPLGMIRICTGLVVLYIHLIYSLDLQALVGQGAWVDHEMISKYRNDYQFNPPPSNWAAEQPTPGSEPYAKGLPIWSVYYHVTQAEWVIVVHVLFLLSMFLFTIGFCTRVTGVLTWLGVISYIQRATTTLFGMDTIMNVLVIYLMIAPCGATLSVDRLLKRWWARRQGKNLEPVQPLVSANFALRLMQVHFCFIYMASGLSKLQGPAWWNGTAVWGTMANYSFSPMYWPAYLAFLRFLSEHRFLWETIMFGGTMFTLVVEISFSFMIWSPRFRWLMICLSVLLHIGIGVIMGLTTFSLFMLCLVLCFVPAETMHAFLAAVKEQLRGMKDSLFGEREPRQEPALAGQS